MCQNTTPILKSGLTRGVDVHASARTGMSSGVITVYFVDGDECCTVCVHFMCILGRGDAIIGNTGRIAYVLFLLYTVQYRSCNATVVSASHSATPPNMHGLTDCVTV